MTQARPDPATLQHLYIDQELTTPEIAVIYGVSYVSVRRWLRAAGIPTRSPGRRTGKTYGWNPGLEALQRWNREFRSTTSIAAQHDVAPETVRRRFRQAGLSRPSIWEVHRRRADPDLPDADTFRALYESGLSLAAIGDLYGVSTMITSILAQDYEIETRPDGWKGGKRLTGTDDHQIRSSYELRVCDWLTAHDIGHEIEPSLGEGRWTGDFLTATGWYIEVWGVQRYPPYEKRRAYKRGLYAVRGLPLVELSRWQFAPSHGEPYRKLLRKVLDTPPDQ